MPLDMVRCILLTIPTRLGAVRLMFLLRRLLPEDMSFYSLGVSASGEVDKPTLLQIRQELGRDQLSLYWYKEIVHAQRFFS